MISFSILIPSWNNLPYLKLCIESIRKHSTFSHQIIVHVNEGADGTLNWLQAQKIEYTYSTQNVGICVALNQAAALAKHDYYVYMNDDMYCLPQWDLHLIDEIKQLNDENFMLSSTMIEPTESGNKAVIVKDYGRDVESFQEMKLLVDFQHWPHPDWSGSSWPPNIVHKNLWKKIGGYNEYFSPGMSSDDDFAMRMWMAGCRVFKGISASRVYHFQCKSTGRIEKNDGRKQFRTLYGMTQNTFNRFYLRKGQPYKGPLPGPGFSPLYWLKKWFS